jgi:hypothetical protein
MVYSISGITPTSYCMLAIVTKTLISTRSMCRKTCQFELSVKDDNYDACKTVNIKI